MSAESNLINNVLNSGFMQTTKTLRNTLNKLKPIDPSATEQEKKKFITIKRN